MTLELRSTTEIEQAMQAFSSISENLVAGYEALAARAEHVEAELCIANEELARKVSELDAVKGHLEAILESLPSGVVVRDADERVTLVNDAALDILDCESAALIGEREHPGLRGSAASGEPFEFQGQGDLPRVLAARYSPVVTKGGDRLGSVEILDDRTELTRMTRRVHELDKMAALGTMAGGIAHEIRNPLNAVKGFAALLLRHFDGDSREAEWAALICEGVEEANTIITNLLTFAEPDRLRRETVDARALVEDAVAAVRRDLDHRDGDRADWSITTHSDEVAFVADRIKLRQALRNLVANSVEAQPRGGRVHVELTCEGGEVVIRVDDAGPGISKELLSRIADPFFTTRAEGTGLGLALVHTIARLHEGRIEFSSQPSPLGGAAVLLRFPLSTGE